MSNFLYFLHFCHFFTFFTFFFTGGYNIKHPKVDIFSILHATLSYTVNAAQMYQQVWEAKIEEKEEEWTDLQSEYDENHKSEDSSVYMINELKRQNTIVVAEKGPMINRTNRAFSFEPLEVPISAGEADENNETDTKRLL